MPRYVRWLICVCLLGVCGLVAIPARADTPAPRNFYLETGHAIQGRFLDYWAQNGGLAIFGFPVSDEIVETTPQGTYKVQYFERNRFEAHPENNKPYDVLLGLLGNDSVPLNGVDKLPAYAPVPAPTTPGSYWFKETRHSLSDEFLQYWLSHGGLPVFGFPTTEPFTEQTAQGTYTVQYFERNRFELHPAAPPAYRVLLGLLGNEAEARNLDPDFRRPSVESNLPLSARPSMAVLPAIMPQNNLNASLDNVQPLDLIRVVTNLWLPGNSTPPTLSVRLYDGANRKYLTYTPDFVKTGESQSTTIGALVHWRSETSLRARGAAGAGSVQLFDDQNRRLAAAYGAYTLKPVTTIRSGDAQIDRLWPQVTDFLRQDRVTYYTPPNDLPRRPVTGYRSPDSAFIWLRDHVYQSRAFKYVEPEMKSVLDFYLSTQKPDGSYEEYFQYEGGDIFRGRIQVEADVEYLMVMGAYTAWQATGDDAWLAAILPKIEHGLNYTLTSPLRWNTQYGLVIRAFTIDTWDFEYDPTNTGVKRDLGANTKWSIFHGDNTGFAQAARMLATMYRHVGQGGKAAQWQNIGDDVVARLNKVAWNGTFFTHMLHLTPVTLPPGQNEATQLSLSNAYNLTRDVMSQQQAAATIHEYQARRATLVAQAMAAGWDWKAQAMAEWFAIDKPFISGYSYPQGEYVNGGKMPLVGGALARGAFAHGFEGYGLDILRRYSDLTAATGAGYLWYHPDGRPGISNAQTLATDGWGAAEMGGALLDGLAGIQDNTTLFRDATLAPRWAADPKANGEIAVVVAYGASNAYAAYRYAYDATNKRLTIVAATGARQQGTLGLHLLLPAGAKPATVARNGAAATFSLSTVEGSTYLDLPSAPAGLQTIELQFD